MRECLTWFNFELKNYCQTTIIKSQYCNVLLLERYQSETKQNHGKKKKKCFLVHNKIRISLSFFHSCISVENWSGHYIGHCHLLPSLHLLLIFFGFDTSTAALTSCTMFRKGREMVTSFRNGILWGVSGRWRGGSTRHKGDNRYTLCVWRRRGGREAV